ncbi:MAG: GAF domain-containing protein, partial [Candidatus Kapaibacterium sp.]
LSTPERRDQPTQKGNRKKKRRGKQGNRHEAEETQMSVGGSSASQGVQPPTNVQAERQEALSATTIAVDAAAAPQNVVRRQIRMVLDELSPDSEEESFGAEPRAEFVRLVNQVLKGIARSIDGRSIIFFWMNLEKGHFIPEASVTQGGVEVRLGERIKLSNDLVSQIARGGVPEIITNISPAAEHELAPYYKTKADTHSFVGVPVYFRHEVVGVLAADSTEESGFDEGSVATLAEYTLLISQLIRSYAEKFDLYLMRQSVEAFERLHTSVTGSGLKPPEIAALLTRQAADMFDPLFAAVALFDKEEGEWRIASCNAASPELQNHILSLAPDMRNSLAGGAARRADEIYLPEVGAEMQIAPGENLPGGGSFLALPLMASAKCYGSLILGQTTPGAWVARDIDLLRDLARYVAMAIEVVNTNEALEEQLVFDEETGLYNTAFFMGGFDREIDRARDFKTPLSLALVRVETPTSFAPERKWELMHTAVTEVGNLLARKLRPYDLIGRFGEDTFSIALIGRSDQEAYLWAERLRKDIAGHIIPFESRTFSVTISAGVSNATDSSDKSNVINGARQALEKASKDGGNSVVIY